MSIVTLSPKYQVVIPRDIREQMDLKPGQKFMAMLVDGHVALVPVEPIRNLRGRFPGLDTRIEREDDRF